MKRTPITAEVVYAAIERHGPVIVRDIGVCSHSHAMKCVNELRAAGRAYIHGWKETSPGIYSMLIAIGSAQDAPYPKLTPDEARARRSAQYRRWKEAKRPKVEIPPPTLPTHTPRIGVWGL